MSLRCFTNSVTCCTILLTRIDSAECVRDQRCAVGRRRATQPVHGELCLEFRGPGTLLVSYQERRATASQIIRQTQRLPSRRRGPGDVAPTRTCVIRLSCCTPNYDPANPAEPLDVLVAVRDEIALIEHPDYNRLPHAFSHIFAGRLRGRLLQLQVGGVAGCRCIFRICRERHI